MPKENEDLPLQPLIPTEESTPSRQHDDDATSSTSVSDEEIFVDCESDNPLLMEVEQREDSLNKVTDDRSRSLPISHSSLRRIDRCYEALNQREEVLSSSDNEVYFESVNSVDLGCITEYCTDEEGNFDYVDVEFSIFNAEKDMSKLMKKLRLNHYTAVSCEGDFTLTKCKRLFQQDYHCEEIDNSGGRLSRHYPPRIIVPVARKSKTDDCKRSMDFNVKQYTKRVEKSVSSRLRTRFVVPVMLFNDKFICRSGTLAVRKTAVYETARMPETPKAISVAACALQRAARFLANSLFDVSSRGCRATSQLLTPNSIEKLRDVDAQIIRDLKIQYICDLMIEDKKTFKQLISLSSSEKINKGIYGDCSIEQMPYPGCKLFKRYYDRSRNPEGLVFDWNRPDVNTEMMFSENPCNVYPFTRWSDYKEWDLVDLTKNYLKMILYYLAKGDDGLLVHCISGWDRTPLFISILRASLWADGLIHESLNYHEMAYLMLAYDWYLFGHDFPNRLRKRQEIMHFCFKFLPYIISDEFSITRIFQELPAEKKRGRKFPEFVPNRRDMLHFLSVYVLGQYSDHIDRTQ